MFPFLMYFYVFTGSRQWNVNTDSLKSRRKLNSSTWDKALVSEIWTIKEDCLENIKAMNGIARQSDLKELKLPEEKLVQRILRDVDEIPQMKFRFQAKFFGFLLRHNHAGWSSISLENKHKVL